MLSRASEGTNLQESIYRASIAGGNAKIVGATEFEVGRRKYDIQGQYCIRGTRVLGGGPHNELYAWPYSNGGQPLQKVPRPVQYIYGVVVSPVARSVNGG